MCVCVLVCAWILVAILFLRVGYYRMVDGYIWLMGSWFNLRTYDYIYNTLTYSLIVFFFLLCSLLISCAEVWLVTSVCSHSYHFLNKLELHTFNKYDAPRRLYFLFIFVGLTTNSNAQSLSSVNCFADSDIDVLTDYSLAVRATIACYQWSNRNWMRSVGRSDNGSGKTTKSNGIDISQSTAFESEPE